MFVRWSKTPSHLLFFIRREGGEVYIFGLKKPMKRYIAYFTESSSDTELHCKDGELAQGLKLPAYLTGGDIDSSDSENENRIIHLSPSETGVCLPVGSTIIFLHHLREEGIMTGLLRLSDGALAWIPMVCNERKPEDGVSIMPGGIVTRFTFPAFPAPLRVDSIGERLIFCYADGLKYSRWEKGKGYCSPASLPSPREPQVIMSPVRIEEFMSSSTSLPTLSVSVRIKTGMEETVRNWLSGEIMDSAINEKDFEDIRSEVRRQIGESFLNFRNMVADSGFFLFPRYVYSALLMKEGERILQSGPVFAAGERMNEEINLVLVNATVSNGMIRMILSLTALPYKLSVNIGTASLPPFLKGDAAEFEILLSEPFDSINYGSDGIPDVGEYHGLSYNDGTQISHGYGWKINRNQSRKEERVGGETLFCHTVIKPVFDVLDAEEEPEDVVVAVSSQAYKKSTVLREDNCDMPIDKIEGMEVVNSTLFLFGDNQLGASPVSNPYKIKRWNRIEGDGIKHIVPSMRALSTGQLGEFPLYAFCRDGIRALRPDGHGGYTSVQLISRDICDGGISLSTSAVVFSTLRGVLSLEGSTVKMLEEEAGGCEISYYYPGDIIIYGNRGLWGVHSSNKGIIGNIEMEGGRFFEKFPYLFYLDSTGYLRLITHRMILQASDMSGDFHPGMTTGEYLTRGMKLGDVSKKKHIRGFRFLPVGVKVKKGIMEVSDNLQQWYPYLRNIETGSPLTLGRGWRYCRLRFQKAGDEFPEGVEIWLG